MAQVTDTTTFTAEERRAEVDAWLYETCTQCLQHMVDVVALFYAPVAPSCRASSTCWPTLCGARPRARCPAQRRGAGCLKLKHA